MDCNAILRVSSSHCLSVFTQCPLGFSHPHTPMAMLARNLIHYSCLFLLYSFTCTISVHVCYIYTYFTLHVSLFCMQLMNAYEVETSCNTSVQCYLPSYSIYTQLQWLTLLSFSVPFPLRSPPNMTSCK